MNVLILDFDIFGKTGGGQSVYAKLIKGSEKTIFYYFTTMPANEANLPPNVFSIPYRGNYRLHHEKVPKGLAEYYGAYVEACQFAASASEFLNRGRLDVIDVPDYQTAPGIFIKQAFIKYGFEVGKVVLALHGTNSNSLKADWNFAADNSALRNVLIGMEELLYQTVDIRYAISNKYANEWFNKTDIACQLVSPESLVGDFSVSSVSDGRIDDHIGAPVDIIFVGRREKIKGPDIFIDLAWFAGRQGVGKIKVIGNEVVSVSGWSSHDTLTRTAQMRDLIVEIIPSIKYCELQKLFHTRAIVVLPSRVDTFNLVALEALRLGCPVLISRYAGAAEWLEKKFPDLSRLIIDLDCSRKAAAALRDVLENYDQWICNIKGAISAAPIHPKSVNVIDVYQSTSLHDKVLRLRYNALGDWFSLNTPPIAQSSISEAGDASLDSKLDTEKPLSIGGLKGGGGRSPYLDVIERYNGLFEHTLGILPRDRDELREYIAAYGAALGEHKFGRLMIYEQLIALEAMRGKDLTSAVYTLRKVRIVDSAIGKEATDMRRIFEKEGFHKEVKSLNAMYADKDFADVRIKDFISEQYNSLRDVRFEEFHFIDDRRGPKQRKVAVICSLYNAESKLNTFLNNIALQTFVDKDQVEIVLVDSGSPSNDYGAFLRFMERRSLPVVYARSFNRETIQAAWNRGIKLSRANYLCFYGADEGMHPDCLEILAAVLDEREDIDWVMADSIMSEIDHEGIFSHDVLRFRRTGLKPERVYLDTTYLSWVGGLYRRSIHDRFGYYDPTFRAAGDTEFKSRILSRIQTAHVSMPLGVFNNYPEERVTAHPRAEIEDQRAWYLHRTKAGMASLFDGRDVASVEDLFRDCLGYRKPHLQHISTDFDLAGVLLRYMCERGENHHFVAHGKSLLTVIHNAIMKIEALNLRSPISISVAHVDSTLEMFRKLEEEAENAFELAFRPEFKIFNDNRFEQHSWSWSSV